MSKSLLVILIAILVLGSALGCLGCSLTSLIAKAPTPVPTPTRTPKPTFTPAPAATDTPIPTNTPDVPPPTDTPSLPPTPASTPTSILQPEASVATKILNVRSGPGANYSRVRQVKEGERLKIIGRTEASDWLKILTSDGQEGWVAAEFVTVNADLGPVAVAQAPPPPTPVPATPTPTPAPPAPTSPPQPTATPKSPYQYRLGRIGCTPNCGTTGIQGVVYDANNNYVAGIQVKVSADGWCCGWAETNIYEPYKILLGPNARPGHWYITLYSNDRGTQLSETVAADTVAAPCAPESGGCQWLEVDFVPN
ncbi:MAG: SH3 domain-containing protein [Anaerolineales bacterium]|nr:MAG: SH3 domain-containing protein [Anaerolineales bacterium]